MMMISVAGPAGLIIRGSPQTMRPDCMRTRRGWLNTVNMSIGISPDSLALYRDLQAQQVPQKDLDRLLDQIVGGIEKENRLLDQIVGGIEKENTLLTKNEVLLEKQLVQGAADRMRLQIEVCSVRAVMDTRSVLELCAREYYKQDLMRMNRDTDRVNGFVKGSVLVNAGDKSPKPDFKGLLEERPEQLRVILSAAGFKGSSATWDRNALREDLLNLYSHLSSQVHNSYLVGTLPFTGWCLGGPSASAAAEIIVAITALEATYPAMQDQYNFPLKVLILDRDYKHVLTWQQNDAKTGFDIVTVNPPVHVPDPNLIQSLSPASALAQSSEGTSSPNFLRRWWQSSWR